MIPTIPPICIPSILGGLAKVGKWIWNMITGSDEIQEEISRIKTYNPEKTEANDVAKLNELLLEYRQSIIKIGDNLEREMIAVCAMELKDIMDMFDAFNQDLKIIRAESVKKKFRRLSTELQGTFSDYISRRISLDNVECINVLKLPAGDLKNQRLQELKQNVFIEATDAVVDKMKLIINDFLETVEDAFFEHLDRAEISVEEKSSAFAKLSAVTNENIESAEAVLLKAHYMLAVSCYAEEI